MSQQAVPIVGLTGGMGAGKSTALEILQRRGAAVLSTDAVVHELIASDAVRDALVARFGEEIAPGGVVDRAAVATRAFASDDGRAWLEALLWPMVGERVAQWVAQVRERTPSPRAAVIEVPLLFESGLTDGYDATLAVVADEPLRRQRAAARGHALAEERSSRQLPQEEKARKATFVVRNDGTEGDLERELSAVLDKLGR
ncbi:MAG TPA: dephospho-CoA kinase [Solirubrobacteraceae bacterium]|jgi:dephospho-CoA kinase|nr:dephospho-CoA kinase [Solirubrobacteraceae bacterium]